jgi:ketosteroid isomerase-like protein
MPTIKSTQHHGKVIDMNATKLVGPVANYVAAANAHDIEAMVATFNEGAVVRDEGKDRRGIAAIRQWAVEVSNKYHPTVEALGVAQTEGNTILSGRVSGDFPGSPIDLRYVFTLAGGKIECLEIS